jgi:hypothetical protein
MEMCICVCVCVCVCVHNFSCGSKARLTFCLDFWWTNYWLFCELQIAEVKYCGVWFACWFCGGYE